MTWSVRDADGNRLGIQGAHASTHLTGGADAIPASTPSMPGLMSALDKGRLDDLGEGNVIRTVRNSTGSTIARGKLVVAVGGVASAPDVVLADKNDSARRPAVGWTREAIAAGDTGTILLSGALTGIDTSTYAVTDQLVLGSEGEAIRPPPDTPNWTGEIQGVGSVEIVDAALGSVAVSMGMLLPVYPVEIIHEAPRPLIPVSSQTTRAVSTTLEGAAYLLLWRTRVARLYVNVTSAPGGGAVIVAGIYQSPEGKRGTANLVASFSIDATTAGLKSALAAEGAVEVEAGLFYFLLGKVSGAGTPSLTSYDVTTFDLLNGSAIPNAGYPPTFTTALSPSPLPSTFDPRVVGVGGQATATAVDTAYQIVVAGA